MGTHGNPESLRVLIVEDSPYIRTSLEDALSRIVNVVVVGAAETEADALLMCGCPWDLLILDLQLKQGNGFDVLTKLDDDACTPRGRIAVFTSHASPYVRARALALGADFVFDNAHEFDQMLAIIGRLAQSKSHLRMDQKSDRLTSIYGDAPRSRRAFRSRGAPDRTRINLGQEHAVHYWTQALDVTEQELWAAVAAVGSYPDHVREHLKKLKR